MYKMIRSKHHKKLPVYDHINITHRPELKQTATHLKHTHFNDPNHLPMGATVLIFTLCCCGSTCMPQ